MTTRPVNRARRDGIKHSLKEITILMYTKETAFLYEFYKLCTHVYLCMCVCVYLDDLYGAFSHSQPPALA